MFRLSFKTALIALSLGCALLFPSFSTVQAQSGSTASGSWLDRARDGGLDTVGSEAYGQDEPRPLQNIVTTIIRIILGFLGLAFLVLIIVAGIQFMTAGGNEENVKAAVARIRNAVIGLLIVLCAYSITYFITNRVVPAITNRN